MRSPRRRRRSRPRLDGERGREAKEAELVLSLEGGMTFPIRISGELSPCASRFTWRVPALPTSQARLGLRTGEHERDEEWIEVLSGAFTVLPDPERRPETLYGRGGVWWIPEAPAHRGPEDGLRKTLHGAASQIALPVAWTEISVPTAPVLARPQRPLRAPFPDALPVERAERRVARSRPFRTDAAALLAPSAFPKTRA